MFRIRLLAALIVVAVPATVSAHVVRNLGILQPDPDELPVPTKQYGEPLADTEIQRMAFDMEHASCDDLEALAENVRYAVLVTAMLTQRPGALSKIIGPECMFAGEAQEIALIEDPRLTVSGKSEHLYYIPDTHTLLVTNTQHNAIAYGLFFHDHDEGQDPVDYFIENRQTAERTASFARVLAEASTHISSPPSSFSFEEYIAFSHSSISSITSISSVSFSSTDSSVSQPERLPSSSSISSISLISSVPSVPSVASASSASSFSFAYSPPASVAASQASIASGVRTITPEAGVEPRQQSPANYGWLVLAAFILIGVALLVFYLRMRGKKEDTLQDE